MSTRRMMLTAMLTALLCITGPLTLPVGPVPVSLTTAVLMFIALLDGRRALLSCGLYLLIGLLGLPVFSGFTGGAGRIFGPTGGFLLGYLPMTALCGFVCARTRHISWHIAAMMVGTALLYLLGAFWYCRQAGVSAAAALTICVLPFLPGDVIKIVIVLAGGNTIKSRLKKAGLLK